MSDLGRKKMAEMGKKNKSTTSQYTPWSYTYTMMGGIEGLMTSAAHTTAALEAVRPALHHLLLRRRVRHI